MSTGRADSSAWERQWELFHAALELEPDRRQEFLERACPDLGLRLAVGSLLAAHGREGPLEESLDLDTPSHRESGAGPEANPAEPSHALRPGQILADRFEIVRLLGQGGMGTVYEAYDPKLETALALKVLRPEIASSPEAIRRFRREIQLARQVTHPGVCRVFDFYQDGALDFLTMELVRGVTLDQYVADRGGLPLETIADLFDQICGGLSAAHAVGVIHRDLKPSNIMVVAAGGSIRAVLMDFGVARTLERVADGRGQLTVTGQILGTPVYMAPEQLQGETAGPPTDVYALGVILFELVTGRRPFEGDTPYSIVARRLTEESPSPAEFRADLDPRWEHTIVRCLERRPGNRFASAAEVAEALRGHGGVTASRRRRSHAWKVAAIAVVVVVTGLLAYWRRSAPEPPPAEAQTASAAAEAPATEVWVLVADFENGTDDPLFDGTVGEALRREISNSRHMRLVPRERVADALRLMGREPDSRLDLDTAREVALRDGKIPAVVGGGIEALGSGYLVSADVIDVTQGVQIGGASLQAESRADVLPVIRQLSHTLRDSLGESGQAIRESTERLERVTTPSLRALKLYTRADDLILTDPEVAIELLTEAIDDDPSFAMAHLLLAFAFRNTGRPSAEYQQLAQRAFDLSEHVAERELFFIRASYYSMMGEWNESIKSYATLLRLHPDHRWGGNNLFNTLSALGRMDEATPYALLNADNRPNDFLAQTRAAMALTTWSPRPDTATPYLVRARELRESMPESDSYLQAWFDAYPVFAAWLEGDPEQVEAALRALENELRQRTVKRTLATLAASGYEAIGQVRKAAAVSADARTSDGLMHAAVLAWVRDDPTLVRRILRDRSFRRYYPWEPTRMVLLAIAGDYSPERARDDLAWLYEMTRRTDLELAPAHVPGIVEGVLSFAEGDFESAVDLLAPSLEAERQTGSLLYFVGSDVLASAYEALGNRPAAQRALETAAVERRRSVPEATLVWMRVSSRLARMYRELGQAERARPVEDLLSTLLSRADPDFPISL